MTKYVTRVVLKRADGDDYEQLHDLMDTQGFSRTVTSTDGKVRQLPDAEYYFSGNFTIDQLLDRAKVAAGGTGLEYAILVTQATALRWVNLKSA
ncbi:type V toxin-antitoxin system endoribonuclease antitoxin GhoS [Stenotrophomonas rhizophila]|uniref:type V toxin-antitoxin system endoribonuclease antitoxin GhoS n=1 Tax=Stenotrophomonas rhizophila TaxID=216778 RepID=UPI0010C02488|nr:type V toxin-antitoxin system endoribonuclease antitoxin GhoS [Stenotrophomonas rhizophila]TKK07556.1 hypothetical protein SrhCFBP13529_12350 [Stenotrophomonas rhizophila]